MEKLSSYLEPFEPVTLQRPMELFGTALTDVCGVPVQPKLEFLVRLVTDHRSHQSIIRSITREHFKNFENFVRRRHQQTSSTLKVMSTKFHATPADMEVIARNPDGPLAPDLLDVFALMESVPYRLTSHELDTVILCQHCKANILDDRDAFWAKPSISFNSAEYHFADRLLCSVVGVSFVYVQLSSFTDKPVKWSSLYDLAAPKRHPLGNWLRQVQDDVGAESLADLAIKLQLLEDGKWNVPYGRIKKWSSGQDLMPVTVGNALSRMTSGTLGSRTTFILARALAFVVDFLLAAAPGEKPKRATVQAIVHDRYIGLIQNLRTAVHHRSPRPTQPPPTAS